MTLSKKQKKYLRRNFAKKNISQLAGDLKVSKEIIEKYLKVKKPDKNQDSIQNYKEKIINFNLKKFIKENYPIFLLLAFLVFVAYFNSFDNEFLSDDIGGIVENKKLDYISHIFSSPMALIRFFYPLLHFVINQVFGKIPAAFRSVNIIFHYGTVSLLFLIVSLLLNKKVAIFAACLAAVHPIITESVTWISGGGRVISAFFILLSVIFYFFSVKAEKFLYFSLISSMFALSISENAIIFPFILGAIILFYGVKIKNIKKLAIISLPAIIWIFILALSVPERIQWLRTTHYQRNAGLVNPLFQIPVAISSYLELIAWPAGLTLYHSEMVFSKPEYILRLLITIAFFAAIIFFFKKNRHVSFWLLFFFIALLPTLTPFGVSWIVAERYVYLGSMGIFIVIAIAIDKMNNIKEIKGIPMLFFPLVVLALLTRTIIRNNDWQNQDTLWLAAAKTSPSSAQNHNNLGDYYARNNNLDKAIEEFQTAIKINPNYGDAYHNLANIYWRKSDLDSAVKNYEKALEFNPNIWQTHQNLAVIYFQAGKTEIAQEHLEKSIAVNPQNSALYFNFGSFYLQIGDKEKAREFFQKGLAIDPNNTKAKEMLIKIGN